MLSKRQKASVVKDLRRGERDTGSAEVQVGLLTRQIKALASHLKKNPKDHDSRRGLLQMVGKRRRFLQYIEKNDPKKYTSLVKKLKF